MQLLHPQAASGRPEFSSRWLSRNIRDKRPDHEDCCCATRTIKRNASCRPHLHPLTVTLMPNKRTSNARPEPRSPNQHSDPPSGRRRGRKKGKKAQDGQVSNKSAQRSAGQMEQLMLPTPFVQESTSQRRLTNPDTARPSQSLFEGAHHFRTKNVNVTLVNSPPIPKPVDGVPGFCDCLLRWILMIMNVSPFQDGSC
jgi:hypothetical protein